MKHVLDQEKYGANVEAVAETIQRVSVDVITSADSNVRSLFLVAIAARCRNFHAGSLALSKGKLLHPLNACLRSLLEHCWVFTSLLSPDPETMLERVNTLQAESRRGATKLANGIRGTFSKTSPATPDLAQAIDAVLEHCMQDPCRDQKILEWAASAKQKERYEVIYRSLSMSAHPSLHSMEDHLIRRDEKTFEVVLEPRAELVCLHLHTANDFMLEILEAFPGGSETEHNEKVLALRHQIDLISAQINQ